MPARPRPAVAKYYLFQVTNSVGFIWPIFTLFLLYNDLTFTQIGTLSALSAVLVVAFEIPTGYLSDRIGHRNTLALGMGAMALSLAGFVVASTFLAFVLLYVVWAGAMALRHGTADAWLYEMLRARTDEHTFTRVRGRGGAVYQLSSAVTMIAGGLLYVLHPTYPFVASALLNGLGVVVVLGMPAVEAETEHVGVTEILGVLRGRFTRPSLRVFVPFVALFFAVVTTADTYIQPITVAVFESLSVEAVPILTQAPAVPEEASLGFVYAGFALVAAVASYNAEAIRDRVGLRRALLGVPLVTALLLLVPLALPALAIGAFFVMKGAMALSKPLVNQYLNDRIGTASRATVLSAAQVSYAAVRAPLKPLVGGLADLTTPIGAVATLGAGFLVAGGLLIGLATPVVERSQRGTEQTAGNA
jgi:MFS family permease